MAIGLSRREGLRVMEAFIQCQQSSIEPPAQREVTLRAAIEVVRSAGALRIEMMARQMWIGALWEIGQRDRARAEAAIVSAEAKRRGLRQTASIVALQAACWAVEEDDWDRADQYRCAAVAAGALTGAIPERALSAALSLILALARGHEPAAVEALDPLLRSGRGYGESTFRELVARAAAMAPPALAPRIREVLA